MSGQIILLTQCPVSLLQWLWVSLVPRGTQVNLKARKMGLPHSFPLISAFVGVATGEFPGPTQICQGWKSSSLPNVSLSCVALTPVQSSLLDGTFIYSLFIFNFQLYAMTWPSTSYTEPYKISVKTTRGRCYCHYILWTRGELLGESGDIPRVGPAADKCCVESHTLICLIPRLCSQPFSPY